MPIIVAWKEKIFEEILERANTAERPHFHFPETLANELCLASKKSFTVKLLERGGDFKRGSSYISFLIPLSSLERIELLMEVKTKLETAIMCHVVYPDVDDYNGDLYLVRGNFCETDKNNLADIIKCLSLESFFETLANPVQLILSAADSKFR